VKNQVRNRQRKMLRRCRQAANGNAVCANAAQAYVVGMRGGGVQELAESAAQSKPTAANRNPGKTVRGEPTCVTAVTVANRAVIRQKVEPTSRETRMKRIATSINRACAGNRGNQKMQSAEPVNRGGVRARAVFSGGGG